MPSQGRGIPISKATLSPSTNLANLIIQPPSAENLFDDFALRNSMKEPDPAMIHKLSGLLSLIRYQQVE
jgi:hypothetical protein